MGEKQAFGGMRGKRGEYAVVRLVRAVVLGVALSLVLSGCMSKEERQAAQRRNEAAVAEIRSKLLQRPDVARVEVDYSNYITDPGAASAYIAVKPGEDFEPVIDAAVQLFWQSKISPLDSISIGVVDAADKHRGESRDVEVDDESAALEAKYGPRPVPEEEWIQR